MLVVQTGVSWAGFWIMWGLLSMGDGIELFNKEPGSTTIEQIKRFSDEKM